MTAERYIALLRGVNVGRANRVAMADLREVVAALGYANPRTLLNSGNVVFDGPATATSVVAARLEEALAARLSVRSRVIVLVAGELSAAVAGNPFAAIATDPSRLLLGFLADPADVELLAPLAERDWGPEALALGERVAYAWCPNGVIASALLDAVTKAVGGAITARNWSTVLKLHALVEKG